MNTTSDTDVHSSVLFRHSMNEFSHLTMGCPQLPKELGCMENRRPVFNPWPSKQNIFQSEN
jgi:hypothetical protein